MADDDHLLSIPVFRRGAAHAYTDAVIPPTTPSRPRVWAHLIGALALIVALLPPQPAAAATTTPKSLTVVSTSRNAVGLSWGSVSGATAYTVKYATASSMKGAKSKTSKKPALELTKLKAKTTYYITVTAVSKKGKSKASKMLKVKTRSTSASYTYLAPVGLKATATTAASTKLSWKSRGSGLRYRVTIATKSDFSNAKHYYVKGTSTTVKELKGGTTYYARVRVVTSKKAARSVHSPKIKVGTGVAAAGGGPATIRVASYNVGSETVDAGTHPWSKRRSAVVTAVLRQNPDVIGFQEASQGKLGKTGSANQPDLSQAEDLVKRLGTPYKLANKARYNCENPKSPYKCVAKYQGAANSQKIVYNSTTLKLVKQGSKKTSSKKTKMEQYRYVEWAILRHKATGTEFFFVNVHLDPGKDKKSTDIRAKQMTQILDVVEAKNPKDLPTYIVGDFNSHKWTDGGNKPYDAMRKAGYVDPLGNTYLSTKTTSGATVKKRINTQYSSHNAWNRTAPKKPWINGIYLDYIWTSKGIEVPEWETVVDVDKKTGTFKGTIPSDHNMLRATTIIR